MGMRTLLGLSAALAVTALGGCLTGDAQIEVNNQSAVSAHVVLTATDGAIVDLGDVPAGTMSGLVDIALTEYRVDVTMATGASPAAQRFTAESKRQYGVIISNATPPTFEIRF